MIDYLILILVSLYCWISSFLVHELMHIKSQGPYMRGTVWVRELSMNSLPDKTIYKKWLYYSGGILSGLIYILIGAFLWHYGIWSFYVPFITFGVINFTYGLAEGSVGPSERYPVYIATIIFMIVFWIFYFGVI